MLLSGSSLQNTSATAAQNPDNIRVFLRKGALVISGNLLLIACAHLAVPHALTPVPSTMQTFAVMFLALALGPTLSTAAVCAYLLEGALGAPVFAPPFSAGGLAHLTGPTGGFLLSYIPAIFLSSTIYNYLTSRANRATASVIACFAAELPIFLIGATWLAFEAQLPPSQAFNLATLPFPPGEAVKIALALIAFHAAPRARA